MDNVNYEIPADMAPYYPLFLMETGVDIFVFLGRKNVNDLHRIDVYGSSKAEEARDGGDEDILSEGILASSCTRQGWQKNVQKLR